MRMPKVASYRLTWSVKDQTYQLQETRDHTQLQVVPDSPAWFAWLDQVSSFAFRGKGGHYTARKESRPRGETYWYAYLGARKKLAKKYLGRATDVTLARLEQVAVALTGQEPAPGRDPPTGTTTLLFIEGLDADFPPLRTVEPNKRDDPLLATKLHQPRPRSRLVSRSHLVERLQQSMEHVLTLVSAPAGFGKTTLLAQWLAESGTPAAWLSLEPEDNDPARFLTYVIAALQTVDAQVGTAALELLRTPQPPSLETVVTLLTNDLLRSTVGDFALVLDDYHVITAEPVHRALTALVEHLPSQLHLLLATRADPPLPLSRLRARGQLTQVRATDLRFSSEEASTFLRTSMGLDLSPRDIAALERRTEGWIAGLQLAALSLQGRADVSAFLAAFTGSHRFVLDYLSEEVLTRQPAVVQSFLLHTSILERLSGPLCDAVR
jgi:LuxR family maltose regulon positive regulatory protein